jgi:XTP/dITP diphosphohydrolase
LASPITFCTSNINKFREAKSFLVKYDISLIHRQVSLPEIQNDHISSIAMFSAKTAIKEYPHPLIVEDTGFFIYELKGFPGPYAAFIENTIGNSGVLKLMKGLTDRSADFRTAIAFIQPGFHGHVVESQVLGEITEKIRHGGSGSGWGYDPIFIPQDYTQTYAEMGREQKNRCSHRSLALQLFANWYSTSFQQQMK